MITFHINNSGWNDVIPFSIHFLTHCVVVLWSLGAVVCRTQWAAVVSAGLVSVVEHVHHGNAKVNPQTVDHKEGITGDQCQTIAWRTAHWGYGEKEDKAVNLVWLVIPCDCCCIACLCISLQFASSRFHYKNRQPTNIIHYQVTNLVDWRERGN